MDAGVISKIATHKEAAEKFVGFICYPEIAVPISDYVRYSTPNLAVKKLLPQDIVNHPAAYPDANYLSKCEVFRGFFASRTLFFCGRNML